MLRSFSPWPVTVYIEVRTSKNITAVSQDSSFCQMKCELHPEPMMSLAVLCQKIVEKEEEENQGLKPIKHIKGRAQYSNIE